MMSIFPFNNFYTIKILLIWDCSKNTYLLWHPPLEMNANKSAYIQKMSNSSFKRPLHRTFRKRVKTKNTLLHADVKCKSSISKIKR